MDQVYGDLYDLVESRIKEAGGEMLSYRDTFLYTLHAEPSTLDMSRVGDMPNDVFMQTSYTSLFNILPEEQNLVLWKSWLKEEPHEFREDFVDVLITSPTALDKSSWIQYNVCTNTRSRMLHGLNNYVLDIPMTVEEARKPNLIDYLYKFYIKWPKPLRMFIKKILGRE